jgi:hypothetical protein
LGTNSTDTKLSNFNDGSTIDDNTAGFGGGLNSSASGGHKTTDGTSTDLFIES